MRAKNQFLLFVIYSLPPLALSLFLLLPKIFSISFFPPHSGPVFGSAIIEVLVIIVPWLFAIVNTHLYFIKKIEDRGMSNLFTAITLLQAFFGLIALMVLMLRIFA